MHLGQAPDLLLTYLMLLLEFLVCCLKLHLLTGELLQSLVRRVQSPLAAFLLSPESFNLHRIGSQLLPQIFILAESINSFLSLMRCSLQLSTSSACLFQLHSKLDTLCLRLCQLLVQGGSLFLSSP